MQDQSTNATSLSRAPITKGGAWSLRSWGRALLNGWPLAVAAVAACWLSFFYELLGEWDINPQYNYGYVVPLLGAVLFWRRWPDRPGTLPGISRWAGFLACGLLAWLFPLTVIYEANPEWRLLYWTHGFLVLGLSFCLLYRAGGWGCVRFFAPPLAFMLIAVPWPMEWEQAIIQNMMRLVAAMTVQVAGWLGIPAVQHGNLIEVATGVVGINEACSGIRSLQSGLMLSLFLGELYRLSLGRRVGLVGASLVCVVLANLTRTTFLTYAAANRGFHQMESWHDTTGFLVMIIILPSLFALAHWIRPKMAEAPSQPPQAPPAMPTLPRWVAAGVFLWIGICWMASEAWYRGHEQHIVSNQHWSVAWPVQGPGFRKSSVPEESLAILRCSQSDAAVWKDDEDNQWSAFFLRWNAGKNSAQLAKGHRPDICFPASGAKLMDTYGYVVAHANGLDLPFKYQTFQTGDRLLHVFYCLWSDRVSAQATQMGDESRRFRLQAVLNGERNLGQQVLEVVLVGPETTERALATFQRELPVLVRREQP